MSGSIIYLGNNSFPASKGYSGPLSLTEEEIKNLPLKITAANGKVLYQTIIPDLFTEPLPLSATFKIPTHAQVDYPLRIIGPFDGNSENTKCTVGGKPAEIIAESPRQCIVEFPADAKGPTTITIEENGVAISEKIGGVDLSITAGRMNLKRGESTYIDILITGLENLSDNAVLNVSNLTTSIVTMIGGNVQTITIPPTGITSAGTYNHRYTIQSIQTGDFSINVDLQLPQPPVSSIAPANNWTACNLGYTTCILPAGKCELLQQGIISSQPQLQSPPANPPEADPFTIQPFMPDPEREKEGIIQQTFWLYQRDADRVAFGYNKLGSSSEKKDTFLIDIDTVATDGFNSFLPASFLEKGVYNMVNIGYYGGNQQVVQNSIVVVPAQPQRPSVSNSEIEDLKRKEKALRDSINNINRRIENGTNQMNDNYERRHYLDSLRWIQQQLQYQLYKIDLGIDQIPGIFGPDLSNLLDSLDRFSKKVGGLNGQGLQDALDKMNDEVKKLEDALKACQNHLAALKQEQQDLENERQQIENDQQQAYRDILQAMRDAGYNPAGSSGRNKNTGEFKYNYGLVLRGDDGNYEFVKGIPAQALKKVGELEKKLKDMNARHQQVLQRQKELPGEIDAAKKECDQLSAQLAAAKAAQQKGANAVAEYNYNTADLAELCREINALLEPLANWCSSHPGECSSFEAQLKSIMEDCPKNINNLPDFMNKLNNIIDAKKKKEEEHKKKTDEIGGQIDDIDKKNSDLGGQIEKDKQKGQDYGTQLGNTMSATDNAIANEIARQQQADAARRAELKRICIEFLRSQAKTPEEADMIEELAKVKDQMQKMGEDIKKASELGDQLTKDKLKDLTDKLRGSIDKMLEQFEKFQDFKDKLDEWTEIKKDLETLTKSDKSAKESAEAMGVVLKRIKEQLDKVAKSFPILQLFTAYFGFMVDAFNAITGKADQIIQDYVASLVSMALERTDCMVFINEYMKNNNVDDAVRKAYEIYKRSSTSILTDTSERRRKLEEELRKYVLSKMTDCCLKWAMQ